MNDGQLAEKYREILGGMNPDFLNNKKPNELSGIFLPSVPETYPEANNKVMIVGCETRAWPVLGPKEDFPGLDQYIRKSMAKHKNYFAKTLSKPQSKGYAFFNYVRDIAKHTGSEGLIYSNLLAFSWNKSSPLKAPCFDTIKEYSGQLLRAQIDCLKPAVIIFANGATTANVRKEFFPLDGEGKVCTNGHDFTAAGIPKHQLWAFTLYDDIQCYRIHHPSARARESVAARKYLLTQLPKIKNS